MQLDRIPVKPWKYKNIIWYNIRKNISSDFTIVTMGRVTITFIELGVVKNFIQKF